MTKTFLKKTFVLFLIVFAPSAVRLYAQPLVLPKTAKLVPPETVLLVDIDNFSQLKSRFEKTSLYKFYKDPAMTGFFEDFKSKLKQKARQLDENNVFRTFYDTDILPESRLSLALVPRPGGSADPNNNEPLAVFISQWGLNIGKIKESVDKLVQKNTEMGGRRQQSQSYRQVSIETMIDEGGNTMYYCFVEDCFIAASDIEILKFVVAQIKGAGTACLADDPEYTSAMAVTAPCHDIDLYINVRQILKEVIASDRSGQAHTIISNLGIDNASAVCCSIGLAQQSGSSFSGKVILKINGARKGLFKIFDTESAAISIPGFIPASSYSVSFLNLNIKKAFEELAVILNSFSPQAAAWMYTPLPTSDSPDVPGLKIKDDIIDHLGSQIVITEGINKPASPDNPPTRESLIAISTGNSKALEKSLSLLHSKFIAPANPDSRRELLGRTIYIIEPSLFLPGFSQGQRKPMQSENPAEQPPMPQLAFTVTDTYLIFGTEAAVERAIRSSGSEGNPLSSAKWFAAAKSALPSAVGMAGLQDNSAAGELVWRLLKQAGQNNPAASATGIDAMMLPKGALDLFNPQLLPDFELVRKYLGLSVSYWMSRPDGFFVEFKYLDNAE